MVAHWQVSRKRRARLSQPANVLRASEIFVECNDLAGSRFQSNLRDEMIGKSHAAFAGGIQRPACQERRLDRYTARLQQHRYSRFKNASASFNCGNCRSSALNSRE